MNVSSAKLPTEDLNNSRFQFLHKFQLILRTTKVKEKQCVAWIKDGYGSSPSNLTSQYAIIKIEKMSQKSCKFTNADSRLNFQKKSRSNPLL